MKKFEYTIERFSTPACTGMQEKLNKLGNEGCKHPIKDDYPGCWGVATFASNTKSHDDKGRGRPGDCLLRREQDQLQTAPV